jgi:hypothetical protein
MNSISSSLHSTFDSGPSTPPSDDEVLVRVDGVGKKFCRLLKKSLWYGVCDIASELNPFGRAERMPKGYKNLTTIEHLGRCEKEQPQIGPKGEGAGATESKGGAGLRLSGQADAVFSNPTTSGLAVDSQKTSLARAASNPCSSGEKALDSGRSSLDSSTGLRPGEFWAVQDVSFELRWGECLGLIGHNGAGTQAAWQPLGRLPQVAHRVRRRGKARINTTLLKMLNGLIKPDRGTITMRGRALIALGAGFNPILTIQIEELKS